MRALAAVLLCLSAVVALTSGAPAAQAQQFPAKPLRLVVAEPAGTPADLVARTLAPEVARRLGQAVLIENKTGAGGNAAAEYVARAPADGYTMLLGGSASHNINPFLFARPRYDAATDFAPVIKLGATGTNLFVAPASLPVASLKEFIDYAKPRGDAVSYGSAGKNSVSHLAGAYFSRRAGLALAHVPYRTSVEMIRHLISGQVQLCIVPAQAALGLARGGRVKVLATTTPGRNRLFADIPGSDETGLPDFDLDTWSGIFVPDGTPQAAIAMLHQAFERAMQAPEVVARLELLGVSIEPAASPAEFAAFVRENAKRWELIVKQSGVRVP